MGCCFSCREDSSSQEDSSERTHLLGNPVSNNAPVQRAQSDDYSARYPNSLPKKTDEQSALNRILHETACNVIDVAALDSHNLEQHEYVERARQYASRIQNISTTFAPKYSQSRLKLCNLVDVPAATAERLLSSEPISASDLALMSSAMERVTKSMTDVKVEHKEDLVVPFGIP